ncbi:hypothetical protein [Oscillibacter sp.]|uniref:hypothetical protein n=1 Tax=Oscillibacter sp. TaxID=1945593 RepID=UPI0025807C25|nr:hypothetical protein [Oscillibacter sp.]
MNFSKMLSQRILFCAEDPKEFQGIAVEFYDLILENDHLAALLGCRGNDDIAIQIDEVTGTMTGWHWFK